MTRKRLTPLTAVIAFIVVLQPSALFAADDSYSSPASKLVYPPTSVPFGMTYGDWSEAWWQYLFSIPASTSPILDTTGALCSVAQSSGQVFFLNPSGISGSLVTRTCTVPVGKALWIPIILNECSTVEPAPSHGENAQELRTCAATISDGIGTKTVKLKVDHVRIPNLQNYRVVSPSFNFIMPATDNILGLEGVTGGASASDGYFVMLKPLAPGNHVVHFEGDFVSGPAQGLSFKVTYNLTVQ